MNVIKKDKIFLIESYFTNDNEVDINNKPFPKPISTIHISNINKKALIKIIKKLQKLSTETIIYNKENKRNNCLLCDHYEIVNLCTINNIQWETMLLHYIKVHNIIPSREFIDFVFRYSDNKVTPKIRLNGRIVKNNNNNMLKIKKNQLHILDALMVHGGNKFYHDKNNKHIFKYSEHAGLLHFNELKLNKIIVFANTKRVEEMDEDIFLPDENKETLKYKYIFHTHPPTPLPGGRVDIGILYEFPSINDIFHFIDHYNYGVTIGSIVIAPEGLYIIRTFDKINKIHINENKLLKEYGNILDNCQEKSILKYKPININKFYNLVAQDKTYIKKINKILINYNLYIDYYPKSKDNNNNWYFDTLFLPVN